MSAFDPAAALETLATEYAARAAAIRRDLARSHSPDFAEQAVQRQNDEVLEGLLAEAEAGMRQVGLARLRLAEGRYGYCERCGEAIEPARLAALLRRNTACAAPTWYIGEIAPSALVSGARLGGECGRRHPAAICRPMQGFPMPDSVAAGLRLAPEELTRPFAPEQFAFDTTDDLEPFRGVLGQERAVEALQFGVAMPRPGYNVFVMGEPGTGRFSFVKRYLQAEGKRVATPSDWVYLNNFDEPREPRVIELPPGSATEFSADIDRLIDNLMSTFPAVFEHPAYQQKKNAVDRAFNQRYDRALDSVERRALEKDVALYRDSANVAFTPMKDGKALDEAEFAQLPEAERERFHKDIAALEEYLNEELASLPQWKRESSNQLRELNEETITLALQPLLAPLVEKYNNNPGVCAYLQAMQLNLLKTVVDQLVDDSRTDAQRKQGLIEQYAPNQAIVHHATSGAPVVFESHPTYDNLFGRIEYSSDQGALYTSYRQLRPGALHRANGAS